MKVVVKWPHVREREREREWEIVDQELLFIPSEDTYIQSPASFTEAWYRDSSQPGGHLPQLVPKMMWHFYSADCSP